MFIHYSQIHPGQDRISLLSVDEKEKDVLRKGREIQQHVDGKSILLLEEALPVVRACFGYVLTDGHHDVKCSLKLGAEIIPIRVIADLSHLSANEFWIEAQKSNYVYLKTIEGKLAHPPKNFNFLTDDPNRFFASLTARKINTKKMTSFGMEYPLWVKVNKSSAFIEFHIADALYANGFVYDPEIMGIPPREEFLEEARGILNRVTIPGLLLVPSKTHHSLVNY